MKLEKLPLTPETIQRIHELSDWFDTCIDLKGHDAPKFPWSPEEWERFGAATRTLYETTVRELGEDFEVIWEMWPPYSSSSG